MKTTTLILILLAGCITNALAQSTVISAGSVWKYYDKGSLNTSWRSVSYNDATWKSGVAQLGYGDGDEATVVSYGTNASKKYITTYFRKAVSITSPAAFRNFILTLKRDDGAVVYVNGTERFRSNMPTGSISGNTKALTVASDDGNTWQTVTLASSFFFNGNNVIGVEIHQFSTSDPDISFDLQLIANPNLPPVANAGLDQTITLPVNTATLNGSASTDPDGTISAYSWSQIAGPSTSVIASPSASTTTASNLTQGIYRYRLTVTDNNGSSANDTVVVTVLPAPNQPPVANAGTDQNITLPQNFTTIDGSASSDPDGTISSYSWTQVSGPGSSSINNPNSPIKGISNLNQGTSTYRIVVTDNSGASAADTVTVIVSPAPNQPPVADAGTDQTIQLPQNSTTIDGSASTDPDGILTSYSWTQVAGPGISTVTNSNSPSTSISDLIQGVYLYRLVVTDNNGATASDTVTVTVSPAPNQPPVATAGADQTLQLPQNSTTLEGILSYDPDGNINSYLWSQISGPAASLIASPTSAGTSISNLIQGTYLFTLLVTDNVGASASDTVSVVVHPAPNQAPIASAGNDQTTQLPQNSTVLDGSGSVDIDGTITTFVWNQISGPSASLVSNPSSSSTVVSNLVQGTYQFRLVVTDNAGATASDTVNIIVNAAANISPVANAGTDQSINLPVSLTTLNGGASSDPDGTIAAYSWSQVSGPGTAILANATSASTTVSGLLQGNYVFRLTVTDNSGATAQDEITVIVNPMTVLTAIPFGSVWSYNDSVTAAISGWNSTTFNSAAWKSGPAQLGYGDGDEATVVGYGPSSTAKYITTYFRKSITVISPSSYTNFTLNVKRDDGIIVYINGNEVFRNNMPTGTVSHTTLASTAASDDGGSIISSTINSSSFADGNNLIAVEIHQNAGSSSDISFDLELKGNPPGLVNLTRGPYLQMGNQNAVTIRWRTDAPTDTKFEAGTTWGNYPMTVYDATQTTEHEIRLTGLAANTKYYYRFGNSNLFLQSGTDNFFKTAPPTSNTDRVRIAVFGDCGRNDNNYQTATLSSYQNHVSADPASIMLLLGDNAYNSGTETEYTSNFFNVYSGNILKNHVLFPAPGNHDYANSASRQADHNVPYYTIFSMPTNAECGGVASGTEAFYSYNWGDIHFLSLDSYGYETGSTRLYDTLGPQVTWIKNDLNTNTKKWTIAYWHHPPYTMGSHNSDTETELVKMRQNFIRILERYGVDLILCGHSHDYERSYLLKGYYGNEASFNPATHAVSSSSAKYDGSANSCPYSTVSGPVNHGTVYVVSGSAGASGGVQAGYPHNALPFAQNDGGMMLLEVEDNRLDAKFIRKDGVIADNFTILKDLSDSSTISITAGQSVTLTASWVGNYYWSNGATTRSITVSPSLSAGFLCTDGGPSCLSQQFTVNVSSQRLSLQDSEFSVYPIPIGRGSQLIVQTGSFVPAEISLIDETGTLIRKVTATGIWKFNTDELSTGMYLIRAIIDGKVESRKVIVE